jgi:hypothetical protein
MPQTGHAYVNPPAEITKEGKVSEKFVWLRVQQTGL